MIYTNNKNLHLIKYASLLSTRMKDKISDKKLLHNSRIESIFPFLLVHKIRSHLTTDGILDSMGYRELLSWN